MQLKYLLEATKDLDPETDIVFWDYDNDKGESEYHDITPVIDATKVKGYFVITFNKYGYIGNSLKPEGMTCGFTQEIFYLDKKMKLVRVYDEKKIPDWSEIAQGNINGLCDIGKKACCIHHGDLHGYYEEAD